MESNRYSMVTIREDNLQKKVQISSKDKPEIIPDILNKWQSLIDVAAKMINVPSGLVMRLNENNIEVFLRSKTDGNPYEPKEKAELVYGLYCETVIGTQEKLLVTDATKSKVWNENNPDIDLNMISYLGFPLNWPDGEVFGTVCMLDSKENYFNDIYISFLKQIKDHIETDLSVLIKNRTLEEANTNLEKLNKIKTRFLSLISHDIRGGVGMLDEYVRFVIENLELYSQADLINVLSIVSENTSSIYLTLENLLAWSKNDLADLIPEKEEVDLGAMFANLQRYFHQALLLKKIEVINEVNPNEDRIIADSNMVMASLRNIVSNAIKFNKENGKIYFRTYRKNKKIYIEIEDTGTGIERKFLSTLFSQTNSTLKKSTHGTGSSGLGLVLVKEFLDKNQIDFFVDSVKGAGTKFTLVA